MCSLAATAQAHCLENSCSQWIVNGMEVAMKMNAEICSVWSLESSCYSICKSFLEDVINEDDTETISTYNDIVRSCISMVNNVKGSKTDRSRGEDNFLVDVENLQSVVLLATFCCKIWTKDFEEIDDDPNGANILKSLNDYIEYFCDAFDHHVTENGNQRKQNMIKYSNSQRVITLNERGEKDRAINLFNDLKRKNLILYAREVKQLICDPNFEIPEFLHYGAFILAAKQIVYEVFKNLKQPFLWTAAVNYAKDKRSKERYKVLP